LQVINTTVPPDTVAGPQRNDWIADRIVFTYASLPSLGLQPEQIDFHFVLKPSGTSGSTGGYIRLNLIAPQALQALVSRVTPGNLVELYVTMQIFGELASGQKIATNKVTYTIDVFNSGFMGCRTPGDVRAPTGPCGLPGGQDGTMVVCCKDVTPAPQGCPQ
ncbi:MAG TPA: hypothetical protein VKE49_08070, partial [Myxococcaceae bacterium]|nr:hypothetical protein [Myxococcaceae bacterium]